MTLSLHDLISVCAKIQYSLRLCSISPYAEFAPEETPPSTSTYIKSNHVCKRQKMWFGSKDGWRYWDVFSTKSTWELTLSIPGTGVSRTQRFKPVTSCRSLGLDISHWGSWYCACATCHIGWPAVLADRDVVKTVDDHQPSYHRQCHSQPSSKMGDKGGCWEGGRLCLLGDSVRAWHCPGDPAGLTLS